MPRYGQFGSGPEYTVGVEEEFMLLDRDTLALTPRAPQVLRLTHDPSSIKPEIRQCMIEIATQPWATSRDLHAELVALRGRVVAAAERQGCRVCGGGAHAFSRPEDQPVTDTARYHDVIIESGFPGRWSVVFGTHVHVALSSGDKAMQVTEALLDDLPTLVALSASSPIWTGIDTGMASIRLAVWNSVPRSGIPPRLSTFAEYLDCLESLRRSGAVPDASHVWWDVRSQERLGTIEVRLLDGQPAAADSAALAALVQSLVRHHGRRWDDGVRVEPQRFLVAENRWSAVWHGMGARFAHVDGTAVRAREAVDELFHRVAADASALDAGWALDHLADLADRGGPAQRARTLFEATHDPVAVMRELAALTACGTAAGTARVDEPSPDSSTVDLTGIHDLRETTCADGWPTEAPRSAPTS